MIAVTQGLKEKRRIPVVQKINFSWLNIFESESSNLRAGYNSCKTAYIGNNDRKYHAQ